MLILVWHATVMSQVSVIIKSPSGRQWFTVTAGQAYSPKDLLMNWLFEK